MSLKSTLVSALILFFGCILMSNRLGRTFTTGMGATTAPGENGQYCGTIGCHFSGAFDPVARIELIDNTDQITTKYTPGEDYTIRINADVTGSPAGYGFQIVALKDSDNTGMNGFSDFPNNVREVMVGDRQYVEQSNRLSAIPIEFKWTAPEPGTGDVDFYAVVNAVNGNANTSGDGADTTNMTVTEDLMSSVNHSLLVGSEIKVWPNPVTDLIFFESGLKIMSFQLHNRIGQTVMANRNEFANTIDVSSLDEGLYYLEFQLESGDSVIKKLIIN